MKNTLNNSFFNRETLTITEELLGKYLVWQQDGQEKALMICEVEAYDGPNDLASHASKGRGQRVEVMFGPSGCFYVYLIYGMYWMLNIVVGPKDYPAAILIRRAGDVVGPGRLTKHIKIDKSLHGKRVEKNSGLWVEDRGIKIKKEQIIKTPRIGVDYAGEIWSKKHWRFVLKN